MPQCSTHTWIETHAVCPGCALPYCDACLVEFLGERICGRCRDLRLRAMQGTAVVTPRLAGTSQVEIFGWLQAGWAIVAADLGTWVLAALIYMAVVGVGSSFCPLAVFAAFPMQCGMYMMAWNKLVYGETKLDIMFEGFRRTLNLLLLVLILFAISLALGVGLIAALVAFGVFAQDNAGVLVTAMLTLYGGFGILMLLAGGAMFFVFPHIAARNVNPIEAVAASWEVVRRNFLMYTLAAVLYGIIQSAGSLALCIGALFTVPLIEAAKAQAYADHYSIDGWNQV